MLPKIASEIFSSFRFYPQSTTIICVGPTKFIKNYACIKAVCQQYAPTGFVHAAHDNKLVGTFN